MFGYQIRKVFKNHRNFWDLEEKKTIITLLYKIFLYAICTKLVDCRGIFNADSKSKVRIVRKKFQGNFGRIFAKFLDFCKNFVKFSHISTLRFFS